MKNENYVLHQLLSERHHSDYDLQPRNHDRLLTQKPNSTVESDFIIHSINQSINQSAGLFVWQLKAGLKHAYN